MATIEEFISDPSDELLERFTKDQLLKLAVHYEIELTSSEKRFKASVKDTLRAVLVDDGVLVTEVGEPRLSSVSPQLSDAAIELRLKELAFREKQLLDKQKDRELQERQLLMEHERGLKELELKHAALQSGSVHSESHSPFDVSRYIRMVPPFLEKDVDKYFPHFERVATTLNWPSNVWTLLLQCVLVGKAQEAYSSLTLNQSTDYETVKASILRAYELVPEAYRQRFRNYHKSERQTYVEFAKEKENLFDRWCTSQKAESKEQLRHLILLEEFKNCVPVAVSTYLNEHKVLEIGEAAVLADEFVLTHKSVFEEKYRVESRGKGPFRGGRFPKPVSTSPGPFTSTPKHGGPASTFPEKVCFYCKKPGHIVAGCPVLSNKQKNLKTVALVKTVGRTPMLKLEGEGVCIKDGDSELEGSSSFMMDGFVSLTDAPESKQAIKIWRDTGAFQSLILDGVLPFSEKSSLHSSAIVQGFGGGFVNAPLHNVTLKSALVSDNVVVGVCSHVPIKGVSFILGNDLAGGRVLATPEVIPIPVVSEVPDELAQKHPGVFPVCAVTRAMSKNDKSDSHVVDNSNCDITLSDTFFLN